VWGEINKWEKNKKSSKKQKLRFSSPCYLALLLFGIHPMNRFSMAAAGSALLAISTETTNNDTKSLALHRSKGGRQPLALHLSKGGRPVITEGVTTKKMYFYRPTSTKENLKFNQNIAIFAAPNSQCLGTDTSNAVGVDLSKVKIAAYADGETSVKIEDSVR